MRFISPDEWNPVGVHYLEDAADEAVRSRMNTVVVAGPGAGKTELLAQRACFLLQTGLCPPPKRILAISFKRDAASNLGARVVKRCSAECAQRFDSLTFDAFAKGLVDRFFPALPDNFRPTVDYDIALKSFSRREIAGFLDALRPPANVGTQADIAGISRQWFLRDYAHQYRLGENGHPPSAGTWAAEQWWDRWLRQRSPSYLSFPMIGRLAELLLRTNPKITRALRATYSFVFLDEFQDTTRVQFDLVETAFRESSAILTAVGDNKQRIMGWAEALDDAFGTFHSVFGGERKDLKLNFRSSPELVRVQRHLIQQLDPGATPPDAARPNSDISDTCQIWVFPNAEKEAAHVADHIAGLCHSGIHPSRICVLVKQLVDVYAAPLITALEAHGIAARNEADVQNLLVEPFVELVTPVLLCIAGDNSAWISALDGFLRLRSGSYSDDVATGHTRQLAEFVRDTQQALNEESWERDSLTALLMSVITFLNPAEIRARFPQYQQGKYLAETAKEFRDLLASSISESADLKTILSTAMGLDSVPVMTIHKSKGLEYDTIIFLGLEDDAFWSFRNQQQEDTCAFFVAFSRAENRVVFTFSSHRESRAGYGAKAQTRSSIGALFDMLKAAGIKETVINDSD